MNFFKKLMIAATVTITLTACGTTISINEESNTVKNNENKEDVHHTCCIHLQDNLTDKDNIPSKRIIYFDFDGYMVKDEFMPLLQAHAKYMNKNKSSNILLEGHTDEVGSREYNLALGMKRAEAVRRVLLLLGVSDSQIESVSFGEEKPKEFGSDEASLAKNRRVELEYVPPH